MWLEYVLCYAQSFTLGAAFGGAVVWFSLKHNQRKQHGVEH